MDYNRLVEILEKIALENGANSVSLVSVNDIFVEEWTRQKCKYGCSMYGKNFMCPPYSPAPLETRKVLKGYTHALIVEFVFHENKQKMNDSIMLELERKSFLNGFYKAFSYTTGPCKLCKICVGKEISNQYKCKNKKDARPSMESCGIDVFKTVKKAGYNPRFACKGESITYFGLLLIE